MLPHSTARAARYAQAGIRRREFFTPYFLPRSFQARIPRTRSAMVPRSRYQSNADYWLTFAGMKLNLAGAPSPRARPRQAKRCCRVTDENGLLPVCRPSGSCSVRSTLGRSPIPMRWNFLQADFLAWRSLPRSRLVASRSESLNCIQIRFISNAEKSRPLISHVS